MRTRHITAFQQAETVAEKRQGASGCNAGVKLTQRACRSIARIGEYLALFAARFLIHRLKSRLRHKDLTPHFDTRRNVVPPQTQGDGTYCAHVGGNVFTGSAVTARCRPHQQAIFV